MKQFGQLSLVVAVVAALGGAAQADLIGYWPMNEGSGTTSTADASANSNTGTLNNMEEVDWVAGHTGNAGDYALDFDQGEAGGLREFVDCGTDPSLDVTSAITMSAWIYREGTGGTATQAHGHVINMGGGWSDPGYTMFGYNDGIRCELQGKGTKTMFDNSGTAVATWQHIAIRWDKNADGGTVRVYFDGVQQGTTNTRSVDIAAATQNFQIAQNANQTEQQYGFEGAIDDVAVWDHALSVAEIQGLANGTYTPLTVPEPGTMALLGLGGACILIRRRRS